MLNCRSQGPGRENSDQMAKRKVIGIRDVARESKASPTTVSLILNKRDRKISSDTRERVLEVVRQLGYRPSRLAQGLQAQKAGFLAVLVPQLRHAFADAYFGELISAIQETASQYDYKLLLEVANPSYIADRQYLELFRRHYVDGLLCMGVTNLDTYLADFADGARPMVVVNNYLPEIRLNHVKCDYEQAGILAGDHLLGLGHRHLALIHGASEVQTTSDLKRGFTSALARMDLHLTEDHSVDGLYTEEGGALAVTELMRRHPDLTGILAGNDKMAIGAISGLKNLGLRVPEEVSVIGCDDMHQAEFSDPPLTTIHTPIYKLGQRACELVLQLIEGVSDAVEETHPVALTLRKSTCPPPQSR